MGCELRALNGKEMTLGYKLDKRVYIVSFKPSMEMK